MYSLDPILYISDYSIGVDYLINLNRGNCSIRQTRVDDLGTDADYTQQAQQSGLGYALVLKSPKKFLMLDSEYLYAATRRVREITSDVFDSGRFEFNMSLGVEYAFAKVN
jgi:hypothetical protein